ncbi:hypothetical protein [Pseudomonas sp. ES3-33]|uniref:hypothetical protein n=1 Tax=Pseudomonas sp. ES3-33 TaxID=1628833 RepID=UPI00069615BE|nr:hypothetical protein [Pseudomonas sp. ES3-33]
MTTRAALNILGFDGSVIDVTSLGVSTITTEHPSTGKYLVFGTLGMAPPPLGWGYVVNQMDNNASVAISYADQVLTVDIAVDGQPANLQHSITLHVEVEEIVVIPPVVEPVVVDPVASAAAELVARSSSAAVFIARILDRVETLSYGIEAGEASEEDEAEQAALQLSLKAWKGYKFALGKVATQSTWPAAPLWPLEPVMPGIPADPEAMASDTQ